MNLRRSLRILGYLFWTTAIVAILLGLVAIDWWYALSQSPGPTRRLRWYLITKTDISASTVITEKNVTLQLGWIPDNGQRFVAAPSLAVGKYTTKRFEAGVLIDPAALVQHPILTPPNGGAIVPVYVKAGSAEGVKPGVRLAFAKSNGLIPALRELQKDTKSGGFILQAIVNPAGKSDEVVLMVALGPCQTRYAIDLATSNLVPVVLSP